MAIAGASRLQTSLARVPARRAIWCTTAIICIMCPGLATGQLVLALVASTGALVVGFAAFQQYLRSRTPMIAMALGARLSAGIGTLANAWRPAEAVCTILWGIGLSLMNLIGAGAGWARTARSDYLIVASRRPSPRRQPPRCMISFCC
jgi:hypothetical protein